MNQSKTVGIFVEQGYQDIELWYTLLRLQEAGHKVLLIGTGGTDYKGKFGYPIKADTDAAKVSADQLDALVVPGGLAPDWLRRDKHVTGLVRAVYDQGKPLAAMCHAGQVLASTPGNILKGRTVTSGPSIQPDMEAHGAKWVNCAAVVDGNLITGRVVRDVPWFATEILKALEDPSFLKTSKETSPRIIEGAPLTVTSRSQRE